MFADDAQIVDVLLLRFDNYWSMKRLRQSSGSERTVVRSSGIHRSPKDRLYTCPVAIVACSSMPTSRQVSSQRPLLEVRTTRSNALLWIGRFAALFNKLWISADMLRRGKDDTVPLGTSHDTVKEHDSDQASQEQRRLSSTGSRTAHFAFASGSS